MCHLLAAWQLPSANESRWEELKRLLKITEHIFAEAR